MAKLQGNEEPKKGSGLEYMYLDVKDDYRDGKHVTSYYNLHLPPWVTKYSFYLICHK